MNSPSNQDVPRLRGYTQLATFMADHEYVVLKQYRGLAIRDLLYLQAELCDLQYDYAHQAELDRRQNDGRSHYDRE
ncbi:hypothetical protein V8F33_004041 [Rhypophila sp. PSN 637]